MSMTRSPHRKAKLSRIMSDVWLPIGKRAPSTGSGDGRRGPDAIPTGPPGTPNGVCLGPDRAAICNCGKHNGFTISR